MTCSCLTRMRGLGNSSPIDGCLAQHTTNNLLPHTIDIWFYSFAISKQKSLPPFVFLEAIRHIRHFFIDKVFKETLCTLSNHRSPTGQWRQRLIDADWFIRFQGWHPLVMSLRDSVEERANKWFISVGQDSTFTSTRTITLKRWALCWNISLRRVR